MVVAGDSALDGIEESKLQRHTTSGYSQYLVPKQKTKNRIQTSSNIKIRKNHLFLVEPITR